MTNLRQLIQNQPLTELNMVYVTPLQLITKLKAIKMIKGMSNICNIVALTEPKTTKKCRDTKEAFLEKIEKLSSYSITLNSEYIKNVENQLKRENKSTEEYKKGKNTMPIEKCENNNFFGTFNDKFVIEHKPINNPKKIATVQYFLNGVMLSEKSLPNVLPTKRKPTNQGTEKEIAWRKLYLTNLIQLSINGFIYKLREQ